MYDILAKFYDELVGINYDVYEKIIKEIVKKDDYCLDLACGSGTLISILSKYTNNIMGCDLSTEMLLIANEKNPNVSFFIHDLKDDFYVRGLDFISCTVDSVNYLTEEADLINFFDQVHKNLKLDGYFLFDIHAESKLDTLRDYSYHEIFEDYSYIWDTYVDDDIINHLITFFIFNPEEDNYYRLDEEHFQRVYPKEYILNLLKKYRVKIENTTDRYIFICQKIEE